MKKVFFIIFLINSITGFVFAQNKTPSDGIYGVCEHTTHTYDYSKHERIYPLIQNAGASMVRTDVVWDWNYNHNTGELIFDHLDKVIEKMDNAGIGFLPILNGAPQSAHPLYQENNLKRWNSAVSSFVKKYKYRCPYWEIWNEHNHPNNAWEIGDNWDAEREPNRAKKYTTVLKSTYNTIKGIDPNLKVIYGGTAGVPLNYIEYTLKEGAGQYFDVMNVHPYDWNSNPEDYLRQSIAGLKNLMAKYNLQNKPIWVTEIGWPTSKQPESKYYKQILPIAFNKLGLKTENLPIVFIDDVISRITDFAKQFPQFKEVITIPIEKMKDLDPAKYPVLVPTKREHFKMHFADDLVNYVRKGGTIILPESIPFFYDIPVYDDYGNVKPIPNYNIFEALHFKFEAWNLRTDRIEIPGVNPSEILHHPNERFLVEGNLKGGDTFTPLAYGVKDSQKAVIAALINLNSDLKGNIIVSTRIDFENREKVTIPEEVEAYIVQRAHLLMFAEGVQKVFWYKFMAATNGDTNMEDPELNFGIVRQNLTPKPAYLAYKVLTEMYTEGSSIPVITKSENGIYTAEWKRSDNKKIYAVWSGYGDKTFNTKFINEDITKVVDYIGANITKREIYTATPAVLFFVCDSKENTIPNNNIVAKGKDKFPVKIYPNPSTGRFTLELPEFKADEKGNIKIYNSTGMLTATENNISSINKMDISHLPKGYYIIHISINGKTVIKKIINS